MKPPAFQFYADDFLAGTFDLSPHDVGVVIRLLCQQWNRAFLPNDMEKLHRLAGGTVSEDVLSKFPVSADGTRKNVRLEQERAKQLAYREKQSEFGKKGGRPQKGSEKGTLSQPFGEPFRLPFQDPKGNPSKTEKGLESSPSPSPSPSPSVVNTPYSPPAGDGSLEALRLRIGGWFKRRPTTVWSQKETRALKAVLDMKTPDEDMAILEAYYQSNCPYTRRDPLTLMNNWAGEIDRARNLKEHGTGPGPGNRNGAPTPHRNDFIAGDHAEAQRLRDELMLRMAESDVPI